MPVISSSAFQSIADSLCYQFEELIGQLLGEEDCLRDRLWALKRDIVTIPDEKIIIELLPAIRQDCLNYNYPNFIQKIWGEALKALYQHIQRKGYDHFNDYLEKKNFRVSHRFKDIIEYIGSITDIIKKENSFYHKIIKLGTWETTGSSTGIYTDGASLEYYWTGEERVKVKVVTTTGSNLTLLEVVGRKLNGQYKAELVEIPGGTPAGTEYFLSLTCIDLHRIYLESTGNIGDKFEVYNIPDRKIDSSVL